VTILRSRPMTSQPDRVPRPRLRVNLSVVRGHYADASRPHLPARRRDAMYTAVRDIPILVAEVERLWALACDARQQCADLRDELRSMHRGDH
jgi:hypothetical protein